MVMDQNFQEFYSAVCLVFNSQASQTGLKKLVDCCPFSPWELSTDMIEMLKVWALPLGQKTLGIQFCCSVYGDTKIATDSHGFLVTIRNWDNRGLIVCIY